MAVDEISYIDLLYINQCLLKFLVKLKFCVSDKIFTCLINVLTKPVQNDYSLREGTIFLDVLNHPLLTVSNTDPVSTNFLCHR